MTKNLKWKAVLVVLVMGYALWLGWPPLDIHDKEGKVVEKGKVNLGLDLQGGMHLVLEVDISKLTPEEAKSWNKEYRELINEAVSFSKNSPEPELSRDDILKFVYVEDN